MIKQSDIDALKKEIMEKDRQFSKKSQTEKAKAWYRHFSKDAIIVTSGHEPNIVGNEAIYDAMKMMYNLENLSLSWEPKECNVSDDLSLAYVLGHYTRTYTHQGEDVKEVGKYTNIWRYIDDEWIIVYDIGNMIRTIK